MKNSVNEEKKEIGLKTIFKYILGTLFLVFLIFSGVTTIKAGQLIIGILFFVLSALMLVPHSYFKVTTSLKSTIIVVLCFVLLAMSGRNAPPVEQKYQYYKLGEKISLEFGDKTFSMVVKEIKSDAKVSVSGKEVTTSGSFIIVTGDILNLGSEAVDFKFKGDPELKDNQNRHYTLYGSAVSVGKLQPSVAKEVSYVFEIPKDASGLNFIVKDKTNIAKSVDLKK
jgi:hypothetical protein